VIVWINGAFGAGKSRTAGLVTERIPGARIFDPEYVGHMLTAFVASPSGDFQDLGLWRHLVVQTVAGLAREYPHPWIAPMSLINPDYRREILGGIRDAGADVREVILAVPEERLRERIDADEQDTDAREWRQRHVTRALTTFAGLADACFVDGTRTPDEVADAVVAAVG
jgi:hypothetical protein